MCLPLSNAFCKASAGPGVSFIFFVCEDIIAAWALKRVVVNIFFLAQAGGNILFSLLLSSRGRMSRTFAIVGLIEMRKQNCRF